MGKPHKIGTDRELVVKGIVGVNNRNPRDAKRKAAEARKIATTLLR